MLDVYYLVTIRFEPKDSVELYDAMKAVYKTDESLSKLDPDKYFRKTKSITQKQAREYAAKLKVCMVLCNVIVRNCWSSG